MWAAANNRYEGNTIFLILMAAMISLAWLTLWLSGRSDHHGFLHALHDLNAFSGGGAFMLLFISGWTVMVIAMMLPSSLPLVSMFRSITSERANRNVLVSLLIAGYLAVWSLFGVLVYFGGWALQEALRQSAWLQANTWLLGAGVLALAGIYQFTPLKYHCLDKCRSPFSFITEHWRGTRERSRSFLLGAHHSLFCVGCCWSLMLLMFLVGAAGALLWMLVLGAVMAVEKNLSWGRRIGIPLGVLLLGIGLTFGTAQALHLPEKTIAEVDLAPTAGSGVSGTATFTDTDSGVEVLLEVQNLPEPGATYLSHLHPGACADDHDHHHDHSHHDHDHHDDHHHGGADESVGEIEEPLTPLVADPDGEASSATVIEGATVAGLFSGTGLYVNVHAGSPDSEELPVIACGDLRRSE
jgi:predicted metal-binding membrane protein